MFQWMKNNIAATILVVLLVLFVVAPGALIGVFRHVMRMRAGAKSGASSLTQAQTSEPTTAAGEVPQDDEYAAT